jgi:hypothetical protein
MAAFICRVRLHYGGNLCGSSVEAVMSVMLIAEWGVARDETGGNKDDDSRYSGVRNARNCPHQPTEITYEANIFRLLRKTYHFILPRVLVRRFLTPLLT